MTAVQAVSDRGIEQFSIDELPVLLKRSDVVVWVDITECDPNAIYVLSDVFKFHPLAVRDCIERNRVPKVHAYADHLFVVLHAPEAGEHPSTRTALRHPGP